MKEDQLPKRPLHFREICEPVALMEAWKKVKSKNTAGGIDQQSIAVFAEDVDVHLADLREALIKGTYTPEPYLTIYIPKNENEKRKLGLLSVKDKVVQQAVLDLIHPNLDAHFLNCSYGYRPRKGPVRAARRVWHTIKHEGNRFFLKLDLDNFFDNIPHDLLFVRLQRYVSDPHLLDLIVLCVRMGRVDRALNWSKSDKGVPQGALLSPILSNLYLHDLDVFIRKMEIGYVRYADDFLILLKEEKQAKSTYYAVRDYLYETLKLPINEDYVMASLEKGVTFLGITFYQKYFGLSKEKNQELKVKIRTACVLHKNKFQENFFQTIDGIRRYYGKVLTEQYLLHLDQYIEKTVTEIIQRYQRRFRTQRSIRKALSPLHFITDHYNNRKKAIVDRISGKQSGLVESSPLQIRTDLLIHRKRKQYEDMQTAGLELIITQRNVSLGLRSKGIVIKHKGKNILTAPTANVQHISILTRGVVISSNLIEHCMKKDIPIDFFDLKGKPIARIYDPDTTNDAIWLAQLNALRNGKGAMVAQKMVLAKISNQMNVLKYFGKYRKKIDPQFAALLANRLEKVEQIKASITDLDTQLESQRLTLFGKEGAVGALYWELVAYLLKDKIEVPGRIRQGAEDTFNVLLNYGYGILYSRIWDAVLKARLNPYISFLHQRQKGKPTLTFDLIEEFRQVAVDKVVIAMLSKKEAIVLKEGMLTEESRKKIARKVLDALNDPIQFRGTERSINEIIRLQAKALAAYLLGDLKQYKPFRFKW